MNDQANPDPANEPKHEEVPGGPAATPDTPDGRDAAMQEGEEA